jgi:uncharacterized membrane protein YeaQ/YmgE (transglycosylase-associated protein family)
VVLWYIIALVVEALIVGGLARLALPGPDPMSIPMTIALGIAGTFLGGIVAYLFLGHAGGLIFALLGSTLLLYLHRRFVQHRPITGQGAKRPPF